MYFLLSDSPSNITKYSSSPDKPSPPCKLCVTEITGDSAVLTWEKPEYNGDSPITGYILEKRDVNHTLWEDCTKTTDVLSATITNLQEGSRYLFRIAAQNKCGMSDFEILAKPVIAKYRKSSVL